MKKEKVVTDLNIFTILIPRIYQTLQYNIIYNKLMLFTLKKNTIGMYMYIT